MSFEIHLVDLHGSISDVANTVGWTDITVHAWTDIRTISMRPGIAFVSPANSLGFMDGGVDYVLSRQMFSGIEPRVKAVFAEKGLKTMLGRSYLPIGKAVTVDTQHENIWLIAAPTMWLPQDVRVTNNAYHAMYAILKEACINPLIQHIYITGLCTGCGMVDPIVAVRQMKKAFDDFNQNKPPSYTLDDIVKEQPCFYMNTEFKHIDADKIIHT